MPLYSINDPKHWLDRAKEARALAEQMDDPEAKRTMLKNADDYERLAQRAEARAAERWPQSSSCSIRGNCARVGRDGILQARRAPYSRHASKDAAIIPL
jgi:hypothetical protein